MRRRFLPLLLALVICLCLIPTTAQAATQVSSGQIQDGPYYTYWKLYNDGSLVFTGNCDIKNFTLTGSQDDFYTPWHNASRTYGVPITSIRVEGTFHSIGSWAFWGLDQVTSITLSDSVWYINEGAFDGCTSLKSVTLPSSLYSIGYLAFAYCDNLETVDILSTGLRSVDSAAFKHCPKLKAINVSEDSKNFTSVDGVLFNKDMTILYKYPAAKADTSYSVPSTVTTINDFSDAANLSSVTLPEGLKYMDRSVFEGCTKLTSITIPDGVKTIPFNAFWGCYMLRQVTLPSALTTIETQAFYSCHQLTSIEFPEGLKTIESSAFYNCRLTNVVIPSTVTTIDPGVFSYNGTSKVIVLSKNCTFGSNSNIFSPAKPQIHGWAGSTAETWASSMGMAFTEHNPTEKLSTKKEPTCTSTGIDIYGGCSCGETSEIATAMLDHSYTDKASNSLAAAANCTYGAKYYVQCNNCTAVSGDLTVTSGEAAPDVHSFVDGACEFCGISGGTFGDSLHWTYDEGLLTVYGSGSISVSPAPWNSFCDSITTVVIESGVTGIGAYAFQNCTALTEIYVPATVTSVGRNAFGGCTALTDQYYEGSIEAWKSMILVSSADVRVHGNCTGIEGHWTEKSVPATCVAPAYTCEVCPCDSTYERNRIATGEADPRAHSFADGKCERCGILGGPCGDNAWWILDSEGNMTIYGEGDMKSYRWSAAPWVEHADNLKTLVVEPGITNISFNAFGNCTELASVSLPETVEEIANSAFANCSKLAEINIPDTVTTLEPAFLNCSSLTSITIPEGITEVGHSCFEGCTSLASVTLPSTVTVIADYAFNGCSSLVSIELPDGLTEIGRFAFQNCSALTSLELPESLTSIGAVAFCGCSSLTEMAVPEGITTIDLDTFQDCTGIETLILPASITTINQDAFLRCTPNEVFFDGTKSAWNFRNAPYASYVHYETTQPEGHWYAYTHDVTCTEAGYTCIACDCGYETNKTVTDAAPGHDWLPSTCVSPNTCSVCGTTSGNPVPGKHTYEDYVCKYCGTTMGGQCGDDAWWTLDAEGLLTITGQGDMWDYAWNGRPWLSHDAHIQTIVVEDGITSVGDNAFCHADNLTSVTLADSVISIGQSAFKSCDKLNSIQLPEGLETIKFEAFAYCYGLTEITIPESVTFIGVDVFESCTGLTEIRIPAGVTALSDSIFRGCSNLVSVELPEGLTSIGAGAFFECGKLESLSVPAGVTSIGDLAFSDCKALKYLVFYGEPTFSTDDVFRDCWNLADVYYAGTAEEWSELGEFFAEWSTFLHYECTQPEGHWEPHAVDADCTEDGYTAERCACGHERNKQITDTALGHDWDDASCTAPKTCSVCGTTEGNPLDHTYKDGNCTLCGEKDPDYVPPVTDPEPTEPDPTEPDSTEPDSTEPDSTEPDSTEPDSTEPDSTEPDSTEPQGSDVIRLAGEDRFDTAFKVAEQMKTVLGKPRFDAIVLASGTNFADALSGSYLAAVKNAPILLGYKGEYNMKTILYIHANLEYSGTVYILGGEKAVSKEFDEAFETLGIRFVRLAGADRFETNLLVLKEAGVKPGQEVLVCTGTDFADSLSGSATGLPILLVYKKLTENQHSYLSGLSGNSFCVVGGENAISTGIEQAVGAYGSTTRLAGKNRLLTSVMVAQRYFDAPDSAVAAFGWNFPDGLCGGPLAYAMKAPLILTHSKEQFFTVAAEYTNAAGITSGYVLGGDGLVSDSAVRSIFSMDANHPITLS